MSIFQRLQICFFLSLNLLQLGCALTPEEESELTVVMDGALPVTEESELFVQVPQGSDESVSMIRPDVRTVSTPAQVVAQVLSNPPSNLSPPSIFKRSVVAKPSTRECDQAPKPYTGELVFPSKYSGSDSSRDTLNEEAEQKYLQLTEDIKLLERLVTRWSDSYLEGDFSMRTCALNLMELWAINNALLTETTNEMGESVRKWALATMAVSYLKLTQTDSVPSMSERATEVSKQIIEGWLVLLAEKVRRHYTDRPLEKVNNHDYWAAWAVMATAVISNRADLFGWSWEKFQQGIAQIDERGLLPNELKRETRALSYHNFALQPLVWMAVFSEANGKTLNEFQSQSLNNLVDNTIQGVQDPLIFERLTEYEQSVDGLKTSYSLAWIEVWGISFVRVKGMSDLLTQLRPMKATRLGGNITFMVESGQ